MKRITILLAEDKEDWRNSILSMLGQEDYDVTVACDGREAWDLFVEGRRFDLLLTDGAMPEASGDQLLEMLINELKIQVTAILQTGESMTQEDIELYKAIGFKGVIRKRNLQKDLMSLIKEVLNI